jgi:hypothetical protein
VPGKPLGYLPQSSRLALSTGQLRELDAHLLGITKLKA